MHDDQLNGKQIDEHETSELEEATEEEIVQDSHFSEGPLSKALRTSIGKELLGMFDKYRRQFRVFYWLTVGILSLLFIFRIAHLYTDDYHKWPLLVKILTIVVMTAILIFFLFVTQILLIFLTGVRKAPYRTLSPFRDCITAFIYTPLITYPVWISVLCIIFIPGVSMGLSFLSGKEHVIYYPLPLFAVIVFFVLVWQILRKTSLQLWEWQLGMAVKLCVTTGLSVFGMAAIIPRWNVLSKYRVTLGFPDLGHDTLTMLLFVFIPFVWSVGIAIYFMQYVPKRTEYIEPKKIPIAAAKFLSSARSLSLLLLILCFVFSQAVKSYHNRVGLLLEARELFSRSLAYEYLQSKLPGGYYESEDTFEKLLVKKNIKRGQPPNAEHLPQAPQLYLPKNSGSKDIWLKIGSKKVEDMPELEEAEISLLRLNSVYDPNQIYKFNITVRVEMRWRDGTTWENYLSCPILFTQIPLRFFRMYLSNWLWLKYALEFSQRLKELNRKVGESFSSPSDPNTIKIEHVYWATESTIKNLSVSIPVVGTNVRITEGVWILMAFLIGVLVSFQNRLRSAFYDPTHGLGEPWLVLDANTRIERLVAYSWIIGICVAPWLANFYLLSMLTSQGFAGTTSSISSAMLRGVGLMLSVGIGGWCSFNTTILILWLRLLRRKKNSDN